MLIPQQKKIEQEATEKTEEKRSQEFGADLTHSRNGQTYSVPSVSSCSNSSALAVIALKSLFVEPSAARSRFSCANLDPHPALPIRASPDRDGRAANGGAIVAAGGVRVKAPREDPMEGKGTCRAVTPVTQLTTGQRLQS